MFPVFFISIMFHILGVGLCYGSHILAYSCKDIILLLFIMIYKFPDPYFRNTLLRRSLLPVTPPRTGLSKIRKFISAIIVHLCNNSSFVQ